jgi:hypothetical protein
MGKKQANGSVATSGEMRQHLAKLLHGLEVGETTVDIAMASARLAEQINASFFAEARMAKAKLERHGSLARSGGLSLNEAMCESEPH